MTQQCSHAVASTLLQSIHWVHYALAVQVGHATSATGPGMSDCWDRQQLAYKLKAVYLTTGMKNYAYSQFRRRPAVFPRTQIITDINDATLRTHSIVHDIFKSLDFTLYSTLRLFFSALCSVYFIRMNVWSSHSSVFALQDFKNKFHFYTFAA